MRAFAIIFVLVSFLLYYFFALMLALIDVVGGAAAAVDFIDGIRSTRSIDPLRLALAYAIYFSASISASPELFPVFIVVPMWAIAAIADRFGRRLQALTLHEALQHDTRPPVLYLRSFDEDKLKVNASLTKSGLFSLLTPLSRRRFEEVLVSILTRYGPVIAIAPPAQRLAPIGAARESLSNDTWRARATELADSASLIVVSATPDRVREGLAWEIDEILLKRIDRVMLVRAPWKPRVLDRRWLGFLSYMAKHPRVMSGLDDPTVAPRGAAILTRDSSGAWRGYGAVHLEDWTYAAATYSALARHTHAESQMLGDAVGHSAGSGPLEEGRVNAP